MNKEEFCEQSQLKTNYDKLMTMSVDELAEWLDENVRYDCSPWSDWFEDKYCSKCEKIIGVYEGSEYECEFAPCEWGDDPCGFAHCESIHIVKAWLQAKGE